MHAIQLESSMKAGYAYYMFLEEITPKIDTMEP